MLLIQNNIIFCILVVYIFNLSLIHFAVSKNSNVYCSFENFHPACLRAEVIVMTSAIYGRMKEGRCLKLEIDEIIKQNPRYFGCSDDVLEWMDKKCSGKQECNFRINDQELRQKSSCYLELEKYLEASYSCVAGENAFQINF